MRNILGNHSYVMSQIRSTRLTALAYFFWGKRCLIRKVDSLNFEILEILEILESAQNMNKEKQGETNHLLQILENVEL